MQNSLASDILKSAKRKTRIWQIATIVCLTLAVVELVVIVF